MNSRVAIAGMGLVTALGAGVEANWSAVRSGRCGLTPLEGFSSTRYLADVAGRVPEDVVSSAAGELRSSEKSRALALAAAAAREALAGLPRETARDAILVLSTTKGDIASLETAVIDGDADTARRALPWQLARALAAELGLGESVAVSNACASGLVAVWHAARLLHGGRFRAAVVVGVDIVSHFVLAGFSSLAALSKGPCRPYDAARDGLSLGEGAGALVLVRPDSGAPVRAWVTGLGVTNDANHITAPLRSGRGLIDAVKASLEDARISARDVDVVNGHGTGTVYNDAMEARALMDVFDAATPPVFSLKGSIGHTLGAAGVIESVFTVKSLEAACAAPTVGLVARDSALGIAVSAEAVALPRARRALSVKSGFGGVNAAAVFERTTVS